MVFSDTPVCRFRETASNSLFDGLNMLRAIPTPLREGALASTVISRSAVAASARADHGDVHAAIADAENHGLRTSQGFAQAIAQRLQQQCGKGQVRACVLREEQKQAAHSVRQRCPRTKPALPRPDAAPIQPTFVAPPLTITDITAILDSEKPNEAKIAERNAKADATPPTNISGDELARFYYERGSARALVGRDKDALADGLQALATARDVLLVTRIRQQVGQQYRSTGDPKQAIAVYQTIMAMHSSRADAAP